MASTLLLSCEAITKAYRDPVALRRSVVRIVRGRPGRPRRPQRLRQVDAAEDPRRPRRRRTAASRSLRGGVRVGYVPQDPVFAAGSTVEEVVTAALTGAGRGRDRPGRAAQALGRAGFARPDARGSTRSRAAGASGSRSRASWRPRPTSSCWTSRPTTSTSRASSGSRSCSTERAARLRRGQPRPLLPRARRHAHARARTASIPTGCFEADGRYSDFLERRDECPAGTGRVPGRRSPTACAARSSGCAAAPRRAPRRPRPASRRRGRLIEELRGRAGPRPHGRPRASTSPPRSAADHAGCWSRAASTKSLGGRPAGRRPRPR